MSLQVRLRHPLGERYMELPARGVDEPVVVGRSSGCDVQVPSVTVAQRHCVLFVHEGRWAVQDGGSGAGTYLNGARIEGASFLNVGDVLSLGPDGNAATIEVDPAGLSEGRKGPVVDVAAAAHGASQSSYPPAAPHPPAYAAGPAYVQSGHYAGGTPYPVPSSYAAVPQPQVWSHPAPHAQDPAAQDPTAGLADAVSAQQSRYYNRRRHSSSSNGAWVAGILITLAVAGGTGYWIYRNRQEDARVSALPATLPASRSQFPTPAGATGPADAGRPPSTVFVNPTTRKSPATAPATQQVGVIATAPSDVSPDDTGDPIDPDAVATNVTPAGPTTNETGQDPASTAGAPPNDAAMASDDPAWKQVQAARFSTDEARAILQFEDFSRTNPDRFPDQIRQYTETALDRIWLERLEQLYENRQELGRKVEETEKDLAEETDDAHKKRVLIPLRDQLKKKLLAADEELASNMKYTANRPPNLLDQGELAKLRQQRDPATYNAWKTRVLAHIRRTHGELPWSDESGS